MKSFMIQIGLMNKIGTRLCHQERAATPPAKIEIRNRQQAEKDDWIERPGTIATAEVSDDR
jgi:hypothetical protein